MSAGLGSALGADRTLTQVLDLALRRGATVVASAGNDTGVGGSVLTRHPAVVPVAACDLAGRVLGYSNLSSSIGRQGLRAPGVPLVRTGGGGPATIGGTSAAAPFVTGALALLLSLFPQVGAFRVRSAVVGARRGRRALVPPLLDARAAHRSLAATGRERTRT